MLKIVDVHVHVFSDPFHKWSLVADKTDQWRKQARSWLKPISSSIHSAQTILRYLPDFVRKNLDELSGIVPLPGLLLESTPGDLKMAMEEAKVDYSVIIAHPPFIPNEFIMELAEEDSRFLPVVNIPKGTSRPGNVLRQFAQKGAKALKIHAASDGEGVDSPRYRALLKAAADEGLPVILHTGCMHAHLLYKDPNQGKAENFVKWYETYSSTKFILAHMNMHEPQVALDICEEFENVYVDTSWQPAEVIGEAARRIGAERVLFGTDWPLVGNNMSIGRKRIEECVEIGLLNGSQAKLILGENAVKLLGLSDHAS